MANSSNNDGVNSTPERLREPGSDKQEQHPSLVGKFVSGLLSNTPLSKWFGGRGEDDDDEASDSSASSRLLALRKRNECQEDDSAYSLLQPPLKRPKLPSAMDAHSTPTLASNNSNSSSSRNWLLSPTFPEPQAGPSGIKSQKVHSNSALGNVFAQETTLTVSSPPARSSVFGSNADRQRSMLNKDNNDSDSESDPETDLNDQAGGDGGSASGYNATSLFTDKEKTKPKSKEDLSSTETLKTSLFSTRSLFSTTQDSFSRGNLPSQTLSNQSSSFNTSMSSRRPTFNPSMFGSPNFVDKTLSTKRILSSPFYSGKTTYGGASAYNNNNKGSSNNGNNTIRQNARFMGRRSMTTGSDPSPLRNSVQIKPVDTATTGQKRRSLSGDNISLSKTARRILNTLEQYSSPVSDAKKIPVVPTSSKKEQPSGSGILSKYIGAHPYLVRDVNKTASKKELQVPSVPELLQMKQKQRLQNSTESVRQIAAGSSSALNKRATTSGDGDYKLGGAATNSVSQSLEPQQSKHTNKMKSNMFSVRQKQQTTEAVADVHLPKIALPITTLPKFDLVIPPPPSAAGGNYAPNAEKIQKNTPTVDNSSSSINKNKAETGGAAPLFRFAQPLVIIPSQNNPKSIVLSPINCFKFSEPVNKKLCAADNNKSSAIKDDDCRMVSDSSSNSNDAASGCDVASGKAKNNGQKVVGFASTSRAPSADSVENKTPSSTNLFSGFDKFKPAKGTWECSACMVRNESDKTKCVACETPKTKPIPASSSQQQTAVTSNNNSSKKWECQSCWVRNENTATKCVACTAAKPNNNNTGTSSSQTTSNNVPGVTVQKSNFGSQFLPAKSTTWECPTCMIRNKNELGKCAACETPNPSAKASSDGGDGDRGTKPSSLVGSSSVGASGFGDKFKSQNVGTWECPACMIRNKNDAPKCAACETPKPGQKSDQQATSTAASPAAPMFNFGIPASLNTTSGGLKLQDEDKGWNCTSCLVKNKSSALACVCCTVPRPNSSSVGKLATEITSQEKPVSTFNFGIPNKDLSTTTTTTTPAPGTFKFGIPAPQPPKQDGASVEQKKNDDDNNVKSTATPPTIPTFSFGASNPIATPISDASTGTSTKPALAPSGGISFNFGVKPAQQEKDKSVTQSATSISITNAVSSVGSSVVVSTSGTNPLLKPTEKLPEKVEVASSLVGFKFGAPTTTTTTTSSAPAPSIVNNNKSDKPSTVGKTFGSIVQGSSISSSSSSNKPPVFEFKPPTMSPSSTTALTNNVNGGLEKTAGTNLFASPSSGSVKRPAPSDETTSNASSSATPVIPTFKFDPAQSSTTVAQSQLQNNSASTNATKIFSFEGSGGGNTNNKAASALVDFTASNGLHVKPSVSGTGNSFAPKIPAFNLGGTTSENNPLAWTGNSSAAPSKTGSFVFGQTTNNDQNKPTIGGVGSGSSSAATVAPTFKFGSAAAASAIATGQTANNNNNPNQGGMGGASSGFNFSFTSVPSGGFNFGSAGSAATPAQPTAIGGGIGGIGSSSSSAFAVPSAAKNGSFNFGSAQIGAASLNNNNQKAIFTFGASQTGAGVGGSSSEQQGAAPAVPGQQPVISFGSGAPAASTSTGFNFAGPPPSFSIMDGTASAQSQRKIKRAIRRTHR